MLPEFSIKRIISAYVLAWFVLLAVQTYILVDFDVSLDIALVDSIISQALFAATTFIVFSTLRYYRPTRENFFYLRLWAVLLAIGNTAFAYHLLKNIYDSNFDYLILLSRSLPLRFCFQLLVTAFVTVIPWVVIHLLDSRDLDERKRQIEESAREAELFNLRQQLQPHFLFNSLNSISALAGSRPDQARKMINQLSEFLRHTLRKDEQQLVSLKEEMHQLDLYLEIEKVRFGHRLQSEVTADEDCNDLLLPVLILQPLVENAIKFGLYDTLSEVMISVNAKCTDRRELLIEISNPYDPKTNKAGTGTGFGLDSVARRLYLIYARNDLLKTVSVNGRFIAKVTIPQR